ncbi:MAG: Tad domain-containing protein [Candidatus Obscuribacterales bacterium]|nr:Tad domain-containing protein [Candidatus Obscuribacterales bacterium]
MLNLRLRTTSRSQRGSILFFGLIAMGLICAILIMLSINVQQMLLRRQRTQAAIESAALSLAGDLSRIVIKDEQYGYVSLCDHPASGKATLAEDGEPLPVTGVNTVLATARLERLIADRLQNDELGDLANQDILSSKRTLMRLQNVLDTSIAPKGASCADLNGSKIAPYEHARQQFINNVPDLAAGTAELVDFKITLGWLADGSSTMTPDPERKDDTQSRKYYPAFENIPVGKNDFYFAGLSHQPRLVDASRFRSADGKRFRSAILVQSRIVYFTPQKEKLYEVCSQSAALPYGNVDRIAFGSLALSLPQGKVSSAASIRDLLDSPASRRCETSVSKAQGGDYPLEPGAYLVSEEQKRKVSACIGRAVFDWLRTTRARVRLDSAITVLNTPFDRNADCGAVILYDFDRKGVPIQKVYMDGGFLKQTVSESQDYVFATNIVETEKGMMGVSIRDHVARTGIGGSGGGGQHGGQPLPAELPIDYSSQAVVGEDKQQDDPSLLRKSSKHGGLAVCIQIFLTPKT